MWWCYYSEEPLTSQVQQRRLSISSIYRLFHRRRQADLVLHASNSFALFIFVISAIILNQYSWASQIWADILGVCLALGAVFQWAPQIGTTWRLGHLGSLSPIGLCFQAPYTWIFGISMIVRVGLQGWSAWIIYVLVGTMQVVLIGFAIACRIREKRGVVAHGGDMSHTDDKACLSLKDASKILNVSRLVDDETSPLLAKGI